MRINSRKGSRGDRSCPPFLVPLTGKLIPREKDRTLDTIVGGGSSLRSRRWLRSVSLDFFGGEVEFSSAIIYFIFFLFSWRLIKIQTHWISSNPTRISSRGGF